MRDAHEFDRINAPGHLAGAILEMCRDIREKVLPLQTAYLAGIGHTWESARALDDVGRATLEAGWSRHPTNPANAKRS